MAHQATIVLVVCTPSIKTKLFYITNIKKLSYFLNFAWNSMSKEQICIKVLKLVFVNVGTHSGVHLFWPPSMAYIWGYQLHRYCRGLRSQAHFKQEKTRRDWMTLPELAGPGQYFLIKSSPLTGFKPPTSGYLANALPSELFGLDKSYNMFISGLILLLKSLHF